jgi:hypothetical protein
MARTFYKYDIIYKTLLLYRSIETIYAENNIPRKSDLNNIAIPFPRLTPLISESLVSHLIRDKNITKIVYDFVEFSTAGGDLIGKIKSIEHKIEVKSSGIKNFQYFSAKDLNADFIIWVKLGNYILGNSDKIDVVVIPKMSRELINILPKSRKISFNSLTSKLDKQNHSYWEYSFELQAEKYIAQDEYKRNTGLGFNQK